LDKYEETVVPGGIIFVDSTLVSREVKRTDVTVYPIPATQMASDNGTPTLANMILVGKILKVLNDFDETSVRTALGKVISAKRADMLEVNLNAMKLGADY
jgi:2-oxoglutarate ferredoxin oxidoreductase subunit gamma